MIRRMTGATGFTFAAGDFGVDGMVIVDPSAAEGHFRFIALPARRMDFNLHPESGDRLFVIIEIYHRVRRESSKVRGTPRMT
jgi:hypothetical protein